MIKQFFSPFEKALAKIISSNLQVDIGRKFRIKRDNDKRMYVKDFFSRYTNLTVLFTLSFISSVIVTTNTLIGMIKHGKKGGPHIKR